MNDDIKPMDADVVKETHEKLVDDLVKERKGERRWRWIRRTGIAVAFSMGVVAGANSLLNQLGGWPTFGERVAVVAVHGPIADNGMASAEKVVPVLRRAFSSNAVKAVVLDIDSPGGSPQETERMYRELDRLKAKYKKPVIAVISGEGASAAYLFAIHADEIVAGKYSMVGSIGALVQTWNVHKLADKVGVSRTTVTSGEYKDLLNPFRDISADERSRVSGLVHEMADQFIAEVKQKRGQKLKRQDIFNGLVWSGETALQIGLVDRIGTLEEVAGAYGVGVKAYGPKPNGSLFAETMVDEVTASFADHLVQALDNQQVTF